jgi:hypothetical protein
MLLILCLFASLAGYRACQLAKPHGKVHSFWKVGKHCRRSVDLVCSSIWSGPAAHRATNDSLRGASDRRGIGNVYRHLAAHLDDLFNDEATIGDSGRQQQSSPQGADDHYRPRQDGLGAAHLAGMSGATALPMEGSATGTCPQNRRQRAQRLILRPPLGCCGRRLRTRSSLCKVVPPRGSWCGRAELHARLTLKAW